MTAALPESLLEAVTDAVAYLQSYGKVYGHPKLIVVGDNLKREYYAALRLGDAEDVDLDVTDASEADTRVLERPVEMVGT